METTGFSMYTVLLSANNDSFTSSFLIWMPSISSSCLITMDRTSSTILNKSGENIGSKISYTPRSDMFADISPRAREIKEKIITGST